MILYVISKVSIREGIPYRTMKFKNEGCLKDHCDTNCYYFPLLIT